MSYITDILNMQKEVTKGLPANIETFYTEMYDGVVQQVLGNYQYKVILAKTNQTIVAISMEQSGSTYLLGTRVNVLKKGNSSEYQITGFRPTQYNLPILSVYQV